MPGKATQGYDAGWWRDIFDELYLVTDARTVDDAGSTAAEVDFIVERLDLRPEHRILDCCGGQGRHAHALASRGIRNVTVLDYSPTLLRLGSENSNTPGPAGFCRGDARCLGLADGAFDHVLVLGNSFGYFEDDKENASILAEIARVLKPGGRVLLDLSSKAAIERVGSSATWHEADSDILVCRQRNVRSHGVLAREIVLSRTSGLLRENRYFCRLFAPEEVSSLLRGNGFRDVEVKDGYRLDNTDPSYGFMAGRMIVTAER